MLTNVRRPPPAANPPVISAPVKAAEPATKPDTKELVEVFTRFLTAMVEPELKEAEEGTVKAEIKAEESEPEDFIKAKRPKSRTKRVKARPQSILRRAQHSDTDEGVHSECHDPNSESEQDYDIPFPFSQPPKPEIHLLEYSPLPKPRVEAALKSEDVSEEQQEDRPIPQQLLIGARRPQITSWGSYRYGDDESGRLRITVPLSPPPEPGDSPLPHHYHHADIPPQLSSPILDFVFDDMQEARHPSHLFQDPVQSTLSEPQSPSTAQQDHLIIWEAESELEQQRNQVVHVNAPPPFTNSERSYDLVCYPATISEAPLLAQEAHILQQPPFEEFAYPRFRHFEFQDYYPRGYEYLATWREEPLQPIPPAFDRDRNWQLPDSPEIQHQCEQRTQKHEGSETEEVKETHIEMWTSGQHHQNVI